MVKFLTVIALYGIFASSLRAADDQGGCAFCSQAVLDKQTFYETPLARALYTHKPIFPGHSLIIPKRHVEVFDALSSKEMVEMFEVIKEVDRAVKASFGVKAYLLLQKNGTECGQSVPHVHFHYIPREEGDDSIIKFIARLVYFNWRRPIEDEELAAAVMRLKGAMNKSEEHAL